MMKIRIPGTLAVCLLLQGCYQEGKELLSPTQPRGISTSSMLQQDMMEGDLTTGTYRLVSWVSWDEGTGKAVGVINGDTADLAQLEQQVYQSNRGREWTITSLGNGEYSVINVNSRKALDLPYGSTNPGVPLIQYPYHGGNSQRWIIEYQGWGVYRIKSKLEPSLGMRVKDGSTANGARITLDSLTNSYSFFIIYRTAYKDLAATEFFRRESGLVASDGATSVPLSTGQVLWLQADGNVNTFNPADGTMTCNQAMVNNAGLLQPHGNWDWTQTPTLLGPGSSSYLRSNPAPGHFNWPSTGIQLGDTVYAYCANLRFGGEGEEKIVNAGPPVWAKIKVPEMTVAGYHELQELGDIKFGRGFVQEGDGFIYAFGSRKTYIHADVYVARFPQNAPNGPWTFWNGSTWTADTTQIEPIGEAVSPVPFVSKVHNKYVLVSTEFSYACDGGTRIFASAANGPTGPFPPVNEIYEIDDEFSGHVPWLYWGKAHPEYVNANDEVLITYNVNGDLCPGTCVNGRKNPDTYRPKGIRVPLQLIDPEL